MRRVLLGLALAAAGGVAPQAATGVVAAEDRRVVDDFEDVSAWSAHPAEGVELKLASDRGAHGKALRIDVHFTRGTGYAVVRRPVSLDLPVDYAFRFAVRGEIPVNHLELKLVDSTGQNVWWHVRRELEFPREWHTLTTRRRQIGFAWGPAGGGELRRVAFLELAITAGEGGRGSVWLDDLVLDALPADSLALPPRARASSDVGGSRPAHAVDGVPGTAWKSAPGDSLPWIELDLGRPREFGGLEPRWERERHLENYAVEFSLDHIEWTAAASVLGGNGGSDPIALPESEARFVRLRAFTRARAPVALREVVLHPLEWAATPNAFFTSIAATAPRGSYPRPFVGEQSPWAVVGLDAAREEALLSEDGMLETGQRRYSIEPFLWIDQKLITWSDVRSVPRLDQRGVVPIPSTEWQHREVNLRVTAAADGDTSNPRVLVSYRVRNLGAKSRVVRLYLAARPFQVNPPWQGLAAQGGVARIHRIEREGEIAARIDGRHGFLCLTPPSAFGAATMDQGDIVEFLRRGRLPGNLRVEDRKGFASAAFAFDLRLPAKGEHTVELLVPLKPVPGPLHDRGLPRPMAEPSPAPVEIDLPAAPDVAATLQAQVGWILVNRDGPALQPGSRSYGRSWIRDGSLTSSALLRMGYPEPVREFIEWFAPFQYENGKVPCCASERGPDPVTENDSHGQFIWMVAEYYRFTGDRPLAERMWPRVVAAVAHLDSLRGERRTAEWRAPDKRRYFGLLLPSISHEGYPNPMHSYWDDFFGYRGYQDAVFLAEVLGRERERTRFTAARDTFARDLAASIATARREKNVSYVPGCAELGDFDATSTTVALTPTGAADLLDDSALRNTFDRYWTFFRDRRDGRLDWDGFTPYEVRVIGSFARLGWRDRANQALTYFLGRRRPPGWRQWAEVEYREPRAPRFLGDLPHTWVGSDFVRSVLDMLAYERGRDSSLVLAAGVPFAWIERDSLRVRGLRTIHGPLSYTLRTRGDAVEVKIDSGLRVPPGGIVVQPPSRRSLRIAAVDGASAEVVDGAVVVRSVPARIEMRP